MDSREQVASYLKTLSICHYVYAGLAACGSCLGLLYVGIGFGFSELIEKIPPRPGQQSPPPEVAGMFKWMFGGLGFALMAFALTVAVLCFLSARAMGRRRNRTLSLVVAGVVCLTGMLGIALGVFTFVVLLKPEAEALYAEAEHGAAPPV